VVLQGFGATLTMLDGPNGGSRDDADSDFGSPSPRASRRPAMAGGDDMNDDIPF
jgi:hypothetical protein